MAVGMNWEKWKEILNVFAPLVFALVPGGAALAPIVPAIINGISEAQQIRGASGPDKKAHVMAIVADAVAATNDAAGKIVLPSEQTMDAASSAIDTTIAVVNAAHAPHV